MATRFQFYRTFQAACRFVILMPILMFAQSPVPEKIIQSSHFKSKCLKINKEFHLTPKITEGSGLIVWNRQVWTFNDSGLPRIFALDSSNGKIMKTYNLPIKTNDWEDMDQDKHFIYLGNFGNNSEKKKYLQIYRINKQQLLQDKITIDSITFKWPMIIDSGKKQRINFDCEAMAVLRDTIFLFTKEWKRRSCSRIFKIPSTAGNYTATYIATIKTKILVTGATYSKETNQIALCGYSLLLAPRILIFPLPASGDFSKINKGKKIRMGKWLQQIEGIAINKDEEYYMISEAANLFLWRNKPKLYKIKIPEP